MLEPIKPKFLLILPPALLILLNIFLFGAATIYQGNTTGFGIDFVDVIKLYTVPFLISLLALLGIGKFLSKKYLSIYIALIFAAGLLLWIQGNIMVWEYGVFDGKGIEWSKYHWQGWVDVALWFFLITAAIVFNRNICKISSFASIALIIVQGLFLISTYVSAPQSWSSNFSLTDRQGVPKGLFNYSSSFNIVHIILDTFQTDIFQEIIKENKMESDFDGFVLFRENMGVANNTYLSIPAIFSGEAYRNDVDTRSYVQESLAEKGFHSALFRNGYDINFVLAIAMPIKYFTNYYRVPSVYDRAIKGNDINEAATLMDLVLFRHLPHVLKKKIYNNQNWLLQSLSSRKKSGNFRYKDFFQDYIDSVQIKSSRPAYHFMHLLPPHPPYVTDENCEYVKEVLPETRDNYKIEAKCMLNLFVQFIKKLKTLGVYDSSLIILQADTGQGFEVNMNDTSLSVGNTDNISNTLLGRTLALLAIKSPNNQGPMTVSDAKTINTDIPATIMNITGLNNQFKGISVFEIDNDKKRDRIFNNIYNVSGSVYKYKSWEMGNNLPAFKRAFSEAYQLGSVIQFGFMGNADSYQREGWSYHEDGLTWTVGHSAVITIPIDKEPRSSLILKANLMVFLSRGKVDKQTINILINAKRAGTWEISKSSFQDHTVIIPLRLLNNSNQIEITFEIPDATSPKQIGVSNDNRKLGIAMRSIKLTE